MSYYVRKRGNNWILQQDYYVQGQRTQPTIPKSKFHQHYFTGEMSYAEAKAQARKLNEDLKTNRWAQKREAIDARIRQETKEETVHLPQALCEVFEKELENHPDPKRLKFLWRAARRLIKAVKIPTHDWKRQRQAIYNYFEQHRLSPDYGRKITRIMNMWGEFYAAKTNAPYSHLPPPSGYAAGRIRRTYRKNLKRDKASDGLTPELLRQIKASLYPEHWDWLFISLWFGLRPQEVDNLKYGDQYSYFSVDPESGVDTLNILQTKLSNLPDEEQWKAIPILYPGLNTPQVHIIDVVSNKILSGNIRTVCLLGTKYTMTESFYSDYLACRNIESIAPNQEDIDFIHKSIHTELLLGIVKPETKERFLEIIGRLSARGAQGVILGCTEIPLVIGQNDLELPVFDTIEIHCDAIIEEALRIRSD